MDGITYFVDKEAELEGIKLLLQYWNRNSIFLTLGSGFKKELPRLVGQTSVFIREGPPVQPIDETPR